MEAEKLPSDMIALVAKVQVLVVRGVVNVAVTHQIPPVNFLGLLPEGISSDGSAVRASVGRTSNSEHCVAILE